MAEPLLRVEGVSKVFRSGGWPWHRRQTVAIDGVDLAVQAEETLGIVGESGSGKSTLLRVVLQLIRPTTGRVLLEGRDLATLSGGELRAQRRRMQAVFQDPSSSFNPRQAIGRILAAPLEVHGVGSREERRRQVGETLEMVGLPASFADRYPHQLSGGQRQRVAIARAIILRPALVLADEPTSALDVSVQAQILNLFKGMKRDLGLTYVFVSHNLGVIRYVSDHVAVMRLGKIVETGPADRLFSDPQHEYTQALLAAVPDPAAAARDRRAAAAPPGALPANADVLADAPPTLTLPLEGGGNLRAASPLSPSPSTGEGQGGGGAPRSDNR